VGKGARIVANVFDVKTGTRVRTVTQQATDADSLLTAFAPLARAVLAVPPPADAKIGEVGTKSLDAYQAYLLGVKALNRFDLPKAQTHLTRALALDSTFALAHLEYSLLLEWTELFGSNQAKVHALAAQRLGASLPKRERLLIEAGVAMAASEYGRLCTIARSLIAQDSTDIQGVFFLGECSLHDDTVIPSAQDSTIGTFRGSWETAKRAVHARDRPQPHVPRRIRARAPDIAADQPLGGLYSDRYYWSALLPMDGVRAAQRRHARGRARARREFGRLRAGEAVPRGKAAPRQSSRSRVDRSPLDRCRPIVGGRALRPRAHLPSER
jgi:hypothetical protein